MWGIEGFHDADVMGRDVWEAEAVSELVEGGEVGSGEEGESSRLVLESINKVSGVQVGDNDAMDGVRELVSNTASSMKSFSCDHPGCGRNFTHRHMLK